MAPGVFGQGDESVNTRHIEKKIKVLRIIARLNIGGPATHAILLTRHMQSLGYETLLVTGQVGPEEGDMSYLAEAGRVKPIIIPELGRSVRPIDDLIALFRILRLLFKFRPHVVHTHTAKAGTLGRLAAFIYNSIQNTARRISLSDADNPQSAFPNRQCKVVHTFHGHVLRDYFSPRRSRFFIAIETIMARCTDAIAVVAESQKDELYGEFGIGRPEQYWVVPLGFDLQPLVKSANHKGQFLASLKLLKKDTRIVGIIGRLTRIKNHRLFLEAARRIINTIGDHRTMFLVVGDGELRGELESLAERMAVSDRVVFTGWIKDLGPIYADLDVLALTSDNEGTPVAVIEAMATGVPVIATDVGGVKELISERTTPMQPFGFARQTRKAESRQGEFEICERGILVKRGDAEGLAQGLRYLLEQPDLRRQMGQRGKEYALKHYTKERLEADMSRLYRSLL
jgi:glycosyltransferase involved in cell wall biosynthesis